MKYRYVGDTPRLSPELGDLKPGQLIETDLELNGPYYELLDEGGLD